MSKDYWCDRLKFVLPGLLLLLTSCLPLPDLRRELEVSPPTYLMQPSEVDVEYFPVPGYRQPDTPDRFNASHVLRYHAGDEADTILVLMPGIFAGAASFDVLARQLVAAMPDLEVWAVDRRANALEDRSVILESLATGDPDKAVDYYIRRFQQAGGFHTLDQEELAFLASWGLEVHLRDLHQIILLARRRAAHVFLGGHSLGASLVSLYAAFTSAEDPPRYGYQYLDGLLLMDGALGRTGAFEFRDTGIGLGPIRIVPSTEQLRVGQGQPYLSMVVSPEYFARREVIALLASLRPLEPAPRELLDFPATNLALAGMTFDDNYGPLPLGGASVGDAVDARFGGNLLAVLLGGAEGVWSKRVVGVEPGRALVGWGAGDPRRERSDLPSLLAAWVRPETNYAEWYFPVRLALDMTLLDPSLEDTPGFLPNRLVNLPTLAFGAERGLIPTLDGFETYVNARYGSSIISYILPGLTHIDIITARDNPIVAVLMRWRANLAAAADAP